MVEENQDQRVEANMLNSEHSFVRGLKKINGNINNKNYVDNRMNEGQVDGILKVKHNKGTKIKHYKEVT